MDSEADLVLLRKEVAELRTRVEILERKVRWKRSSGAYRNEELRALKFRSIKEIHRAIDLIWSDPDLEGLPYESPDGITLFVPEEAVELLRAKALRFTVSRVLSQDDLPPERVAEMRAKYGM